MRLIFSTLLIMSCKMAYTQGKDSTAPPLIQYPVKGYVLLQPKEKVVIRGISFADSNQLLLYAPGPNILNGAYTFKDDIRTMKLRKIPVADVKLLRVQRQSFLKGATIGGLIGFGLGCLVGYATYQDKFDRTEEENKDRRSTAVFLGGVAGALPAGIAGGLSGGLFIRKRFTINGRRDQLEKTLQRVSQ